MGKSRNLRRKIAAKQAISERDKLRAEMIQRATDRLSPKQKELLRKQEKVKDLDRE